MKEIKFSGTVLKRTKNNYKILSTNDEEYVKKAKDLKVLKDEKRKRTLRERRR